MHGVILAAGNGSRMGAHTAETPKVFLEVEGQRLYDRQRDLLDDHVDGLTVVLGYKHEAVIGEIADGVETIVIDRWADFENAESLRQALERTRDDVLVLNGDVLVAERIIERLCRRHAAREGDSVVGCLPGLQDEHTAIRCDDDGTVTDYGMIRGHRHAGIGIVDRSSRRDAIEWLRRNRRQWYPGIYPEIPTKRVSVAPDHHVEINRPPDIERARRRLPLENRAPTGSE